MVAGGLFGSAWPLLCVAIAAVVVLPTGCSARARSPVTPSMRLRLDGDALLLPSSSDAAAAAASCPCASADLCKPVTRSVEREIFGFALGNTYTTYNWSTITTVAWNSQPGVMCLAHQHGARVIAATPEEIPLTNDSSVRAAWIKKVVAGVQAQFLDGVTFDYERPIALDAPERDYYTTLVRETTAAMHAAIPTSQVSVCVAWSPDGIDDRNYDVVGLAAASDLLYVMMYDTRSQIFDRCIASANAPFPTVVHGIKRYIDIGVPPSKMVLGVPWYAYNYTCTSEMTMDSAYCRLGLVPYLGVNCSDAAGQEVGYSDVMAAVDGGETGPVQFDDYLQTPYFNQRLPDGSIRQIWFDNPTSLLPKYAFARQVGLRGVGPYRFDFVDADGSSTQNPRAPQESQAMWDALATFLEP